MKKELCKRCLLKEAGENKSYSAVEEYLKVLNNELKVSREVYEKRLEECRSCDSLISGMCLKCGCYVEIRAALRSKGCADFDNSKW